MIANITNDLKRATKDSESSKKSDQKIKELSEKISKLIAEKEDSDRKLA